MVIDQHLGAREQIVDDHPCELLGQYTVGITREDAVQVRHIKWGIAGERLERVWIRNRDRDDTSVELFLLEAEEQLPHGLDRERLVTMDPGDDRERRPAR